MMFDFVFNSSGFGAPAEFRTAATFVLLAHALTWHLLAGRRRSRQSTFFGVRVEPNFIESGIGRAILRTFRMRVWIWAGVLAAVCISSIRASFSDEEASYFLLGAMVASVWGFLLAFSKAHRATCVAAAPVDEPVTRSTPLFWQETEASPFLTLLNWLAILLPVGLPIAIAIFLGLHWDASAKSDLASLILAGVVGIFPATAQFALSFRARSSDWAPNVSASRKYRTFLGIAQVSVFTFVILDICIRAMVHRATLFPNMQAYFRFSEMACLVAAGSVLGIYLWLKKHFVPGSGDPMNDRYWKWGWFYYNPGDSALVVPQRSGLGYSFNYGRHSVLLIGAVILIAVFLGLLKFSRLV